VETLHIMTGVTAVGKTHLAIEWARANDAEILSCDSLLFYRGMNIGTAKPSPEELAAVPHHCIDLVPCSEPFNIGRYIEICRHCLRDLLSRGKKVLITGGSGFYLKSFLAPVIDDLYIPEAIDQEVDQLYRDQGLEAIVTRLRKHSPSDYELIDLQNPRRVIPALKRCMASGCTIGELRNRMNQASSPFEEHRKITLLLERSIESIKEKVYARTRQMLAAGLIDEVRALMEQGIERNPSASNSIGYRETIAVLNGQLEESELEFEISKNTMKLVKKQMKWFKNQIHIDRRLNLDQPVPPLTDWFE